MIYEIRYRLNNLRLSWLVAFLSWLALVMQRPFAREGAYSPDSDVPGYTGWISVPIGGTVAFRRNDGSLQFRW